MLILRGSPRLSSRDATRYLPLAVVLAVAAFGTLLASSLRSSPGMDFWRPRAAVLAIARDPSIDVYSRSGRERVYATAVRDAAQGTMGPREQGAALDATEFDGKFLRYPGVDVVQTPVLLAFVRMFSFREYESDYLSFIVGCLLCFFVSVVAICRMVGASYTTSLIVASAIGLTMEAQASELRVANVNDLQLALIALFLYVQSRSKRWSDVASGSVLALAVLFKPNLAAVALAAVIAWIGARLWHKCIRAGVGALVGLAIGFGASAAVMSPRAFQQWSIVIPELMVSSQPVARGNLSLSGLVAEQTGIDVALPLLVAGLIVYCIVAMRPLWSRAQDRMPALERTLVAVSAGAAIMLLSSRLVWVHYFVLAVPLLIVAGETSARRRAAWIVAAAALPLTGGVSFLKTWAGDLGPTVECLAVNLAVLVPLLWTLAYLWRAGAPEADAMVAVTRPHG